MKLDAVVAAAVRGGFIAADRAPELTRLILAEDKRAKDNTGLGPKNLQHADDEREAALDEREETMDAAEEKADAKDESKEAKDRKGARDKRAKDRMDRKGARDKRAKDRNDDPEHTNDTGTELERADPEPPGGPRESGSTAVDSAEVDRRVAAAIASRDALHAARIDVQPILGVTTYDSAGETYRKALSHLGVDVTGIPDSALRAMLTLAKDRASAATAIPAALDSATSKAVAVEFPGLNRLRR